MDKEIERILIHKGLTKGIISMIDEYLYQSYLVCLTHNFRRLNNSPKLKFINKLNFKKKICKLII